MITHHPRKSLGQNFLRDEEVLTKIISAINFKQSDHIVEIGPGLGALTKKILPFVQDLDVIELDRDLIPHLEKVFISLDYKTECFSEQRSLDDGEQQPLNGREQRSLFHKDFKKHVRIYQADAVKFNFYQCQKKQLLRVVGNLPYNISTSLIFHLLTQLDCIADMHFMLQREVGERLAAASGKAYGRLSVMVQYFCEVTKLFTVSPHSFYPVPKVESVFIRLVPRKNIELKVENFANFEMLVKQAFGQRRKTISNSLKSLVSVKQLEFLGIDPKLRAEDLSVNDFVRISNLYT